MQSIVDGEALAVKHGEAHVLVQNLISNAAGIHTPDL